MRRPAMLARLRKPEVAELRVAASAACSEAGVAAWSRVAMVVALAPAAGVAVARGLDSATTKTRMMLACRAAAVAVAAADASRVEVDPAVPE